MVKRYKLNVGQLLNNVIILYILLYWILFRKFLLIIWKNDEILVIEHIADKLAYTIYIFIS